MAVKIKDVRAALEPEEPNYSKAVSSLGRAALPHLEKLIKSSDVEMAAKAVSLAGMIADDKTVSVLKTAADSKEPIVRVAAASAARNLADKDASDVLESLVADGDIGVQKTALHSVPSKPTAKLRSCLQDVAKKSDLEPSVAASLRQVVDRIERGISAEDRPVGEMPDDEGATPSFDASTSADEVVETGSADEMPMPDFDEGVRSSGKRRDDQEMPAFASSGNTDEDPPDYEPQGRLQEMPS